MPRPLLRCACGIDVHAHVVPGHFPAHLAPSGWSSEAAPDVNGQCHRHLRVDGRHYRTVSDACWSAPRRLSDFDAVGLSHQVVSPMPELLSYWLDLAAAAPLVRYLNDTTAALCADSGGRLLAWALTTAAFQRPGRDDPISPEVPSSAAFPQLYGLLHAGFIVALLVAVVVWWILDRSVIGFSIRAVGANARAAAFAGIPVTRTVVMVALLSGGLAGLAGAIEVAGRTGYVTLDMSPGYGYSGIVIAMLAGLHPVGVLLASVFVAGVLVGADSMSRAIGVPTYIADVIVAVSLIAMLVATMLTQYRVRRA